MAITDKFSGRVGMSPDAPGVNRGSLPQPRQPTVPDNGVPDALAPDGRRRDEAIFPVSSTIASAPRPFPAELDFGLLFTQARDTDGRSAPSLTSGNADGAAQRQEKLGHIYLNAKLGTEQVRVVMALESPLTVERYSWATRKWEPARELTPREAGTIRSYVESGWVYVKVARGGSGQIPALKAFLGAVAQSAKAAV